MIYRYQEWQDGLHNFDDHVLLSLELCLYLRHSLQVCLYCIVFNDTHTYPIIKL